MVINMNLKLRIRLQRRALSISEKAYAVGAILTALASCSVPYINYHVTAWPSEEELKAPLLDFSAKDLVIDVETLIFLSELFVHPENQDSFIAMVSSDCIDACLYDSLYEFSIPGTQLFIMEESLGCSTFTKQAKPSLGKHPFWLYCRGRGPLTRARL